SLVNPLISLRRWRLGCRPESPSRPTEGNPPRVLPMRELTAGPTCPLRLDRNAHPGTKRPGTGDRLRRRFGSCRGRSRPFGELLEAGPVSSGLVVVLLRLEQVERLAGLLVVLGQLDLLPLWVQQYQP